MQIRILTLHSSKYGTKRRGLVYTLGGVLGSQGANLVPALLWLAKLDNGWNGKRFLARAMSNTSEFRSLGSIWCILTCGNKLASISFSSPSQISLLLFVVFLDSVELGIGNPNWRLLTRGPNGGMTRPTTQSYKNIWYWVQFCSIYLPLWSS